MNSAFWANEDWLLETASRWLEFGLIPAARCCILQKTQKRKVPISHYASKAFLSYYLRTLGGVTWGHKASTIGAL
jgi:hypothetical protein